VAWRGVQISSLVDCDIARLTDIALENSRRHSDRRDRMTNAATAYLAACATIGMLAN